VGLIRTVVRWRLRARRDRRQSRFKFYAGTLKRLELPTLRAMSLELPMPSRRAEPAGHAGALRTMGSQPKRSLKGSKTAARIDHSSAPSLPALALDPSSRLS
jgi:hypothetical protein